MAMLKAAFTLWLSATLCSAACPRPVLQTALDDLFKTIENPGKPSVKTAPTIQITNNGFALKSVQEASFANFTRWAKPFRITVLDEATCNVAAMSVPKYMNNTQILSVRMRVTASGLAEELEVFTTGSDATAVFFGDYLPDTPGPVWTVNDPAPREQLYKNMDSYASGITAGDGNMVAVAPTCTRFENGFRIGAGTGGIGLSFGGCNTGFALIKVPVVGRRWYIDSQTGIGLGNFMFDRALWLHEYFKVQDGKIMQIYAGMLPGWTAPKDTWVAPVI